MSESNKNQMTLDEEQNVRKVLQSHSKSKPNGGKKLIAMILVIIILLGILAGINNYNEKVAAAADEEAKGVTVMRVDVDDLATFSYVLDGTIYRYEKTEEGWIYTDDSDLQLDQGLVTSMFNVMTDLRTTSIISNDLTKADEYGFDTPEFSLNMEFKDGTRDALYIGDENTMVGVEYAYIESDGRIFVVNPDLEISFVPAKELEKVVGEENDDEVSEEKNSETVEDTVKQTE